MKSLKRNVCLTKWSQLHHQCIAIAYYADPDSCDCSILPSCLPSKSIILLQTQSIEESGQSSFGFTCELASNKTISCAGGL